MADPTAPGRYRLSASRPGSTLRDHLLTSAFLFQMEAHTEHRLKRNVECHIPILLDLTRDRNSSELTIHSDPHRSRRQSIRCCYRSIWTRYTKSACSAH